MTTKSFGIMIRNPSLTAFRMRLHVILVVMVAVVASMTLHHGAMASAPTAHDHVASHLDQRSEDAGCTGDCGTRSHSMPACCGIGLCLSGLPVTPQSKLLVEPESAAGFLDRGLIPKSVVSRIDRPPKNSLRAAV